MSPGHDEEQGVQNGRNYSINTVESSSSDESEPATPDDGRFKSFALSDMSSFNTRASDYSETVDKVPELTSLLNNGGKNYGTSDEDAPRRGMHQRTSSDDSICTVAALPGMVLRAHSALNGKKGGSVIRNSTPKIGKLLCVLMQSRSRELQLRIIN